MAQMQKVVSTNRSWPLCLFLLFDGLEHCPGRVAELPQGKNKEALWPGGTYSEIQGPTRRNITHCINSIALNLVRKRIYFHQIMARVSAHRIMSIASVRCVYTYEYIARVIWPPYKSTLIKDLIVFSHFEYPAEHVGR